MTSNRLLNRLGVLLGLVALMAATVAPAATNGTASAPKGRRAPLNTLSRAEKAAGWQLLFNGKDFTGWRGLGQQTVPPAFVVEEGILHKRAGVKNEGDLMTAKTFDNFEFSFEWKISPAGNNGIKYNVSEEMSQGKNKKGRGALGFEYQVLDDEKASDRLDKKHQCGSLYELVAPDDAKKKVKPVGQWNRSKIVYNGNHIEHWLNGQKIVEAELGTPQMNEALAQSKWKNIQGFGDRRSGNIVITDHNDEAWYRNLKIRELPRK